MCPPLLRCARSLVQREGEEPKPNIGRMARPHGAFRGDSFSLQRAGCPEGTLGTEPVSPGPVFGPTPCGDGSSSLVNMTIKS